MPQDDELVASSGGRDAAQRPFTLHGVDLFGLGQIIDVSGQRLKLQATLCPSGAPRNPKGYGDPLQLLPRAFVKADFR